MEVAGAEIVVIQTNGVKSCTTEIHSKLNVVVASVMAPIVVDLIRVFGQQERSGVGAEICAILSEPINGEGR